MNGQTVVRRTREVLLTSAAALGLLCILATIAGAVFGLKPLVFQSGSMSPAIGTGDLGISRTVDASSLNEGDIVSVINVDGHRVTHRVVDVKSAGESTELTLKGDANQTPDRETYSVASAEKVLFHIPKAGYVVRAATSPAGLVVLGAYVTVLVLVLVRGGNTSGPNSSSGGGRRRAEPKGRRKATRAKAVAFGTGISLMVAGPAMAAAWTDDVPITGTTLTAYTVPKPVWVSCTVTGGALSQKTATIIWQEVSTPYALDYTATILETGQSMTVTDNGATRQTQFSAGLLSTVLNSTYNIRIQAKLPSPNGAWVSVELNQPVTITLLGLGMNCGTPS